MYVVSRPATPQPAAPRAEHLVDLQGAVRRERRGLVALEAARQPLGHLSDLGLNAQLNVCSGLLSMRRAGLHNRN